MKIRMLLFDLSVCSVWIAGMLAEQTGWVNPMFFIAVFTILCRLVVSFSLYHGEKRSWLPLAALAILFIVSTCTNGFYGIDLVFNRLLTLMAPRYKTAARYAFLGFMMLWIFILPFICYLVMLHQKRLAITNLTWQELAGGILWHGRLEKHCSAGLALLFMTVMAGLAMNARMCQTMCLVAAPLTNWLLSHYYKAKAEFLWVLVVSMCIFWYAQILANEWRVGMLFVSLVLAAYVCSKLYKRIQSRLLLGCLTIYLGIMLPSFAIGYNQYSCINYSRSGFSCLLPSRGVFYVRDEGGKLGLRDRYGLLVEPEYDCINPNMRLPYHGNFVYVLLKNGREYYYNVFDNKFVNKYHVMSGQRCGEL